MMQLISLKVYLQLEMPKKILLIKLVMLRNVFKNIPNKLWKKNNDFEYEYICTLIYFL